MATKKQKARATAEALEGDVAWHATNAADPAGAEAAIDATLERFGRLDVLVNNVSTNPYFGRPYIGLDSPLTQWIPGRAA